MNWNYFENKDISPETPETKINSKLENLEKAFLNQYNIEKKTLEELYTFQATKDIETLNATLSHLSKQSDTPWEDPKIIQEKFEEMVHIREESSRQIQALRLEMLNDTFWDKISAGNTLLWKYCSPETLQCINDPESISDEIKASSFTLWESIAWTAKLSKDVVVWAFKSPYDLYQYATKKAQHDWVEV